MPIVDLVAGPIDVGALGAGVVTPACGAVVTFAGVVRETSAGDARLVAGLHYEAYPALALAEMEKIAAETRAAFGPLEIAIVHRTGDLALGETSIAIAVAAPHRGRAFDACEYAIDEVKARVAVWKQEMYRDGQTRWRPNAVAPAQSSPPS